MDHEDVFLMEAMMEVYDPWRQRAVWVVNMAPHFAQRDDGVL